MCRRLAPGTRPHAQLLLAALLRVHSVLAGGVPLLLERRCARPAVRRARFVGPPLSLSRSAAAAPTAELARYFNRCGESCTACWRNSGLAGAGWACTRGRTPHGAAARWFSIPPLFCARFRHAARSTRAAQARASATAAACVHACCSPEPASPSRCRRRPPRRARAAVWAAKTSALPLQRRAPSPSPRRVWYVLRARLLARAPYPRRPAGRAALLHALAGRRPRAMAGRARPRERARDRLPPRRRPLSRSPRDPFRPGPTQLAASLRTAARALPGAGGTPARWVSAARVGRRRPPRRAALAAVAAARCERLSARAATVLFFFPPLRRRTQPFGALNRLPCASASMCECCARARELLLI